jgi:thiol-disulfide isomerase/thioredoxin
MMRFLLSGFLALSLTASFGQNGYSIDFTINGWKDTTVYLCYAQGEGNFVRDTTKCDHHGHFAFTGKKTIPQGVYFLVLNKTRIPFDFVIGREQHFKMETDTGKYVQAMKIKGDLDNTLFFNDIRYNIARHTEADPFIKILGDTTIKDTQKKKDARAAFEKINSRVMKYQDSIIAKYPTTLTARIFKSSKAVEVPDPPRKANGAIDSTFQLRYYREHFFDNFDLADDAMLRLPKPVYQEKVKEYLTKLFLPIPDTVTRAIEGIVAKAKKNPETYKNMVYTCVYLYQNPDIMGLDEVFVNLYCLYFASGEMDFWANASIKKTLKERADKISQGMIGHTGPNLIMQDQNFQPRSLYDIKNKYTIIFFFDPDCGHCRIESPKLVDFYNKNKKKYDLEVFAVSLDTSMQKLRNYIKEMKMTWITVDGPRTYLKEPSSKLYFSETTPTIYILDEKKKVIARKLPVEKLDEFLTNYEKFQKRKQAANGTKG